jgi:hypothetical protein
MLHNLFSVVAAALAVLLLTTPICDASSETDELESTLSLLSAFSAAFTPETQPSLFDLQPVALRSQPTQPQVDIVLSFESSASDGVDPDAVAELAEVLAFAEAEIEVQAGKVLLDALVDEELREEAVRDVVDKARALVIAEELAAEADKARWVAQEERAGLQLDQEAVSETELEQVLRAELGDARVPVPRELITSLLLPSGNPVSVSLNMCAQLIDKQHEYATCLTALVQSQQNEISSLQQEVDALRASQVLRRVDNNRTR